MSKSSNWYFGDRTQKGPVTANTRGGFLRNSAPLWARGKDACLVIRRSQERSWLATLSVTLLGVCLKGNLLQILYYSQNCVWLNMDYFSSWSITKPFCSFVIYHKPFCYFNVGMQECFVINRGKGGLCDGCLWLITKVYDKSQKRPRLNKNTVINCGKHPTFWNSEERTGPAFLYTWFVFCI